jgi:HEPN domain-containing protein
MRELHYILRRRSLDYLRASEDALSRGLYDVSGVLAQISAELVVKATISFLGYSFPETHEIRRLLGVLSSITLKDEVQNFINAWFKRLGLMRRKREKKKVVFILRLALDQWFTYLCTPKRASPRLGASTSRSHSSSSR